MHPLRLALLCVVLSSIVAAPAALADGALYLDWDACGPSGPAERDFACSTNSGEERLYCAFSLDQPLDQVLGVEIVLDVSHSAATLPPWWQLGVSGCRFGRLTATGDPPDGADCADMWQGQSTGGVQGYAVGQPRGGANQARIKVALTLLPQNARTLEAGTIYDAARVVFSNAATTGAGSCSGCGGDACLVFNSIWIKRLPGAVGGDVFLSTAGPGNGNMATWQGSGADCAAVPVKTTSWGRIKSLYR